MKQTLRFRTTTVLLFLCLCSAPHILRAANKPAINTRREWLNYMDKLARPVMSSLACDRLHTDMPVALSATCDNPTQRTKAAYLEAFARTLCGISPWLQSESGDADEVALRTLYRRWALDAIRHAVNPEAKDYMLWTGGQPLVDAAFFSFALLRAPWLWQHLSNTEQAQVVAALQQTRATVPVYSNWILFSAMVETFFCKNGLDYDPVRIEYAVREFSQHWYTGDGMFADGMDFHFDYYNSYVIQPFLANILQNLSPTTTRYADFDAKLKKINQRYAVIQERMINTDGSFTVYGRSIVYRTGAFHHLADMTLRRQLPLSLHPAQVREALSAVIRKLLNAPHTFTDKGFLQIGLYGYQPNLADFYINTGSCYLASVVFLPLGLPDTDPFWTDKPETWTAVKIWNGEDVAADHAMDLH